MYKNLIYDVDGKVAKITINRPKAMNALNEEVLSEMYEALLQFEGGSEKVAMITGAGKAFVAGATGYFKRTSSLNHYKAVFIISFKHFFIININYSAFYKCRVLCPSPIFSRNPYRSSMPVGYILIRLTSFRISLRF